MSEYHFDMTGVPLDLAIEVALSGSHEGAWSWYERIKSTAADAPLSRDVETKQLVFAWNPANGIGAAQHLTWFPARLGTRELVPLVEQWLQGPRRYGPTPDIDGHCTRGWRVFNKGEISDDRYAIFAVEPIWMTHHK